MKEICLLNAGISHFYNFYTELVQCTVYTETVFKEKHGVGDPSAGVDHNLTLYRLQSRLQHMYIPCTPCSSMAKWLACWAAVRQPRVRFPPGIPPSSQQEENYLPRCRSHLPSSGGKNTQQENIPRKNNVRVCNIVREITK
jgi:hypothetical protein